MSATATPGPESRFPGAEALWRAGIIASSLAVLLLTIYCLSNGITTVFMHAYYLPILLLAFRYHERGIALAAALAFAYLGLVLYYLPWSSPGIPGALVRTGVFVGIAAVVGLMSSLLDRERMRYAAIFDHSQDGIVTAAIKDGSLRIEESNARFSDITGYSQAELRDLPPGAIWLDAAMQDRIGKLLVSGESLHEIETVILTKSGSPRTVLVSAGYLPLDQRCVFSATDITDRKAAESRFRVLSQFQESIIANANAWIMVLDRTGSILVWNRAAEQISGYAADQVIGNNRIWRQLYPDREYRRTVTRDLVKSLESRAFLENFETTIRCRDGTGKVMLWNTRGLPGEDGQIRTYIAIGIDVTKTIQAEREISRKNRDLAIINEIVRATTSATALDDVLRVALEKTLEILAFEAGAVYLVDRSGTHAELIQSMGLSEEFIAQVRTIEIAGSRHESLYRRGEPLYYENMPGTAPHRAYTGFPSLACIPLAIDSRVLGALYLASRKQVTFSKETRSILSVIGREVGAAVQRAFSQEKVEALNEEANLYLDIISHDINNVNTAALGYMELLIELLDAKQKSVAQKLYGSIRQSVEILGNVATLRKLREEAIPMKPLDLDHAIRSEIAHFPDARIHYDGTAATILADDLITEIFSNLIGNSSKFGGPDVDIWVRVKDAGEFVQVSVEDDGPGIPDEIKPVIFQRFRRGTSRRSGKGLGLFIARMLVERYGGRIQAENRVPGDSSKGAAIRFTLRKEMVR
jgi:PAS domain S-box-containing protein